MSMKKSNDTIGNRTRDLPACSAVALPILQKTLILCNVNSLFKTIFVCFYALYTLLLHYI